ncbi:nuclear transport factor 2 family protein [Umezawaea endophytica]|uniref:Nuclear transport factor 2 family protein n=1 Tax=Umezawaea endophytica TaxID=1654476 RepID=A0A9X3AEU7_9PSEU|nr:nuclear transport factor 2 family protein [Umezawaea endophytica]MCS7477361.1 nuclear transport factor 2 family protein [Umezawaea endophytica]
MSIPAVVTRYLETTDPAALAECFTPDGTVFDEGATYVGREEIVSWREKAASQWTYTTTITDTAVTGEDRYRVRAHLEGDFPGGVADLAFDFTVDGELISSLVIG